ncbi:MAG: hypothetical protein SGJ16_12510 [Nitrospirota bacterium]|nr:hypothetical protein [Nitrospirota bacterium]
MKRRRLISFTRSISMPEDEWAHQPKVHLYRLDPPRKPRFLTKYYKIMFSKSLVAAEHGRGKYLFIVSLKRRVLRKGTLTIAQSLI